MQPSSQFGGKRTGGWVSRLYCCLETCDRPTCALHSAALAPPPRLPALDAAQARVGELEGEMREVQGKMQELKAALYSKFGNQINLEE